MISASVNNFFRYVEIQKKRLYLSANKIAHLWYILIWVISWCYIFLNIFKIYSRIPSVYRYFYTTSVYSKANMTLSDVDIYMEWTNYSLEAKWRKVERNIIMMHHLGLNPNGNYSKHSLKWFSFSVVLLSILYSRIQDHHSHTLVILRLNSVKDWTYPEKNTLLVRTKKLNLKSISLSVPLYLVQIQLYLCPNKS